MKKWMLLLSVVCLGLLGQNRQIQDGRVAFCGFEAPPWNFRTKNLLAKSCS